MALSEQQIDVPFSVLDQNSPKTGGLVGTLTHLIDGQVTAFGNGKVRVDKRPGWGTLPDSIRATADGSLTTGAVLGNQTLLEELGDQLLLLSNDTTLVLSKTADAWASHNYQLPVDRLTQAPIHTSNTLATAPDMACAEGGVCCYTWVNEASFNAGGGTPSELAGCYYTVRDPDGVVLRAPTRIGSTALRIKVVCDGGFFWIFSDKGDGTGNIVVTLLDLNGAVLQTLSWAATYASGDYWDCTCSGGAFGFGVAFAQGNNGASNLEVSRFSYNAGTNTITRTHANVTDTNLGFRRPAWLTNDTGDGLGYLATSQHGGPGANVIAAYQLSTVPAISHAYLVASAQPDEPANLTGYVVPGSAGDLVVACSFIDNTAAPNTNYLKDFVRQWTATHAGVSTFVTDQKSMNMASRAFGVRGRYYYVGYYPSHLVTIISGGVTQLPNQPTFFVCTLNNPAQMTVGRFEYGNAYADWQVTSGLYNFALASAPSLFPSGIGFALSYRAESFTSTTAGAASGGSNITSQSATVGIKSWSFGPSLGKALEYGNGLLLPGPGATFWSGGDFSESGVNLGFEQLTLTVHATGGGTPSALTPGLYQFVAVPEWTDNNGDRVRGVPSPVASINVSASQYVNVSGFMMHATNKRDLLIAIYRTDMVPDSGGGFVATTLHYKITVDAPTATDAPLYNDPAGSTFSFDDGHLNITANEILYTDKGQLASYPAPAFSRGTVWLRRCVVIGDDGALWFSAEKTEGDAPWWHPGFRIVLPTSDAPVSVSATKEGTLIVHTANDVWYVPPATLPDASGANGTIPEATNLHFNMGGTGEAILTRLGVVYGSSAGSLWLVTPALENKWLGQPASVALNGPVSALAVDAQQRIAAVVGSTTVVFDTIANSYYEWSTPLDVQLLTVFEGLFTFGDGQHAWQQTPDTFYDQQDIAGVTTIIPYNLAPALSSLHFSTIRGFASLLEIQLIGTTHTGSTITVSLAFDDDPAVVESTTFVTDPAVPFEYSYGPANQLCSAVQISITESLGAGQSPGQGFSIEALALTVGLYQGANRLPDNRRV